MEVQGKIIAVLPERSGVSARGEWKSQDFVIETMDSQYPRKMVFTVFGADRLTRFNIQSGMQALVAFDIDAHEWNGRWFNDIRAYDVRPADATAQQPVQASAPVGQPVQQSQPVSQEEPFAASEGEGADNLPF